jgi:hypothetical protein
LEIFAILGFENIRDYQKVCAIIFGCLFIAETHHSEIFHIALSNPKVSIVNMPFSKLKSLRL